MCSQVTDFFCIILNKLICLMRTPQQDHSHSTTSRKIRPSPSLFMELEAQRRRGSSSVSSSPEFEFWMVRNPPFPPPDLLTADELIVDGVLLPLHLLSLHRRPLPPQLPPPSDFPPPSILSSSPTSTSRRWKHFFKSGGEQKPEEKEKKKKKERRSSSSSSSSASTDVLNINLNIWPFSRSRSAGNTAARPRSASRKTSSAPCSRSNSRGDSPGGGRRWAPSPGRTGVHLGRSSPVWQFRRTGMGSKEKGRMSGSAGSTSAAAAAAAAAGGGRVLNLNVNSCIGYRNQVSCRDDDSDGLTGCPRTAEGDGGNGTAFSFRALFSKKVY